MQGGLLITEIEIKLVQLNTAKLSGFSDGQLQYLTDQKSNN